MRQSSFLHSVSLECMSRLAGSDTRLKYCGIDVFIGDQLGRDVIVLKGRQGGRFPISVNPYPSFTNVLKNLVISLKFNCIFVLYFPL
ncbi:hypothetical protein VNO78_18215 [Psophocarpus tetragonolobus]|uniref:Uncharacterized protein n=1 Tax=Psophocarpus tetragonolobus TaxID=3891 RepID=A0AAN9XLU9_PSOTE